VGDAEAAGIVGMDLDIRLRQMLAETRAQAGARHGVPLIADAAGVESQGTAGIGIGAQCRNLRRDQSRLAIAGVETAFIKEARLRLSALAQRPLHRRHDFVALVGESLQRADVEISGPIVLERRQRGMLAEYVGGGFVVEGGAEPEARRDLAQNPPVRPRLAGRGKESALPRDTT